MKEIFYEMMKFSVKSSNLNFDLRTKISNASHSVTYENFQECLVDLHLMTKSTMNYSMKIMLINKYYSLKIKLINKYYSMKIILINKYYSKKIKLINKYCSMKIMLINKYESLL